jgi:hypothetical protein
VSRTLGIGTDTISKTRLLHSRPKDARKQRTERGKKGEERNKKPRSKHRGEERKTVYAQSSYDKKVKPPRRLDSEKRKHYNNYDRN